VTAAVRAATTSVSVGLARRCGAGASERILDGDVDVWGSHVLVDPQRDEPLTTVRLPGEHAAVLAALLTGARLVLSSSEETVDLGTPDPAEVVLETVPVVTGSPAVGLAQNEITPRPGRDAVLLGVIDDRTPERLGYGERGIRVGDRLVVAVRRSHLENLRALV
jgi:hypothetical protein